MIWHYVVEKEGRISTRSWRSKSVEKPGEYWDFRQFQATPRGTIVRFHWF